MQAEDQDSLNKNLFYQIVNAIFRHALTAAGASLVANGYLSDNQAQVIIGAAMAIFVTVASVVNKRDLVMTNFLPAKDEEKKDVV